MKNGIVIPCYNEETRLPVQEFINFAQQNSDYVLCFVNDGSADNTLKVLQDLQASSPANVRIVDVEQNAGKANAVTQGARDLYNHTDVANIGFLDADLATDFNDYQALVNELGAAKVVIGSRRGGAEQVERSFLRNLFSNTIKLMIQFITRLPIADTQCGAKVFSRSVIPTIFSQGFASKWLFDVEIFLRLKQSLGKQQLLKVFVEKPLQRWEEVEGSKLNIKDSLLIPYNLMSIWVQYVAAQYFTIELPSLDQQPTLSVN